MALEMPVQPWERQSGETGRAFAAFTLYRDQSPHERALSKVARLLLVSTQVCARWSATNGWVLRAAAWDFEQDRVKRLAHLQEMELMGRRQAAAGALMQTKGLGRIRALTDPHDRNGNPLELGPGQISTAELSVSEATRLVESGVRLERIGRGEGDPYMPQVHTVTNNVLSISVVEFMRAHPTRVGPIVEVLERLRELMSDDTPEPNVVGPGN